MDRIIVKYWARALASRYLYAWVPYLRYVGLNGSLVRGGAKASSDIDLMVVAEPGHIFTVRFLIVGIIALVGIKRTGRRIADRLCINYFLTTDNLDIKPHNRRVAEAYKYMVALIDDCLVCHSRESGNLPVQWSGEDPCLRRDDGVESSTLHNRIMRQNKWMRKYRVPISSEQLRLNASIIPVGEPWQTIRLIMEMILFPVADVLEKVLKKAQIAKIKRHPLTGVNSNQIIVNDNELRFHPVKHPNTPEKG